MKFIDRNVKVNYVKLLKHNSDTRKTAKTIMNKISENAKKSLKQYHFSEWVQMLDYVK